MNMYNYSSCSMVFTSQSPVMNNIGRSSITASDFARTCGSSAAQTALLTPCISKELLWQVRQNSRMPTSLYWSGGGFLKLGSPQIYVNGMFHSKQTILGYPHDYGNLHVFLILRIRSPVYSMVEKRGKMFHGTPLFLAQKLPEEPILDSLGDLLRSNWPFLQSESW